VSESDDWFKNALEDVLRERIVGYAVRPGTYRSSWDLREVDVQLSDGRRLALAVKRFDVTADAVKRVKPAFLVDPAREIAVYRTLLSKLDLGTARFYGSSVDGDGRPVLILEYVDGTPLWQVGDFSKWLAAARWLGRTHSRLETLKGDQTRNAALLRYDAAYYRVWPQRACLARAPDDSDEILALLASLPHTIIHGEFHASNIVVADGDRICVLDWEMAAVGPGLMDLADLTSGNWSPDERRALADAYRGSCHAAAAMSEEQLRKGLAACRLHRALQWLGWSNDHWTPPPEHAHDWTAEANAARRELGG
jgi:aminoglycoside phosphotransferase (APT) family kinase protein